MRNTQGNTLRSLVNVKLFIEAHADRLGDIAETGVVRELGESITELSGHVKDQADHALAASQTLKTQGALRRALLREHMAPIARIAQLRLPQTPELAPLRMPRPEISIERLVAAARGMGTAAARCTDVLVSAGLPRDFVARLEAATDALLASLHSRDQSRGKAVGATEGLAGKLSRGRKIVNVLDVFIQNALAGDADLLRTWRKIKRVEKTGARSVIAVEPVTAVAPTAAPDAAAA